jgi:hypothetical protein
MGMTGCRKPALTAVLLSLNACEFVHLAADAAKLEFHAQKQQGDTQVQNQLSC